MVVRGIRSEAIAAAAEGYGKILKELKCSFGPPRKNPGKGQISFNLQVPRKVTQEAIEAKCNAEIPKEAKGTIDWPED